MSPDNIESLILLGYCALCLWVVVWFFADVYPDRG